MKALRCVCSQVIGAAGIAAMVTVTVVLVLSPQRAFAGNVNCVGACVKTADGGCTTGTCAGAPGKANCSCSVRSVCLS